MFLFLLDCPDQWRAKGRNPEDHIDVFEDGQPSGQGLVSYLQILTQGIDRQGGSYQVRQAQGEQLEF